MLLQQSEVHRQDFNEIKYLFGVAKNNQTSSRIVWSIILAIAAVFDILATILPSLEKNESCNEFNSSCTSIAPLNQSPQWVRWLDRHHITISFSFSALWFLDAFRKAYTAKHCANITEERSKLADIKSVERGWMNSNISHYIAIIWQLLLLPMGFYVAVYVTIKKINRGERLQDLDEVDEIVVVDEFDITGTDRIEVFSVRSTRSFLFVLVRYIIGNTDSETDSETGDEKTGQLTILVGRFKWNVTRHLIGRAVRNPFKFYRQVMTLLAFIRYLQYGFPLVVHLNRIRGLVVLAIKRQRQRIKATKAKRARQLIWERKPKKVLEQDAAIMIQSAFRARRIREKIHALRLIKMEKEHMATLKIQFVLKRKLTAQRVYLQKKREEFQKLQSIERKRLSEKEALRMFELRDELFTETKDILERKMLLRPNTKFAVYWKLFFALCLLWEFIHLAAKPYLLDENTPTTLDELIALMLVPTRVSELEQCQEKKIIKRIWNIHIFARKRNNEDRPWYCHEPYAGIQESFRNVVALTFTLINMLINLIIQPAVGMAYILDVFITFFTGVFHPDNGALICKPFFERWIIPGIALQLIVNPFMQGISEFAFNLMLTVLDLTPLRVWRWIASICPLLYVLLVQYVMPSWLKLVEYQNLNQLIRS